MKLHSLFLAAALALPLTALSQVPVQAEPDHEKLLKSADPKLAANKRIVYDFHRDVLEGGHMELAEKYLAEDYKQHNPNVPTGRAGFVKFFTNILPVKPIQPKMQAQIVAVTAEDDIVVFSMRSEQNDPKNPGKKYTTTWFDMFRVNNGKITEHWDPATIK